MPSTKDIALDTRFFCLFKGDPGTGKSIAAGSYPGHKDDPTIGPYFFDIDRRMKSVINYWRPRGREFNYDHFDSFFQINDKLEQFLGYCPYHTLVFDGITQGGKLILRSAKALREGSKKKVMVAGIEMSQIEDYGGEATGLDTIINNLQVISIKHGVNVIVTAHVLQTESTNIKNNVTTVSRSILTGGKKVAAGLPVAFDEAYHFDVQPNFDPNEMPKHTIVTHNVGEDWAKTALPLPLRIDFTGGSLYDEIMKHLSSYEFVHAANEPTTELATIVHDGEDVTPEKKDW